MKVMQVVRRHANDEKAQVAALLRLLASTADRPLPEPAGGSGEAVEQESVERKEGRDARGQGLR
jgi:hypothetical protein